MLVGMRQRTRILVAIGAVLAIVLAGVGVGWWATRPATGIGAIADAPPFVACAEREGVDVAGAASWTPDRQRALLSTWAGAACVLEATDDARLEHVVAEALPPIGAGDDADDVRELRAGVLMALVADAEASVASAELVDAVGRLLGAARANDDAWWLDDDERLDQATLSTGIQLAAAFEIVARDGGDLGGYEAFLAEQGLADDARGRILFLQGEREDGTPLWERVRDVEQGIDDRVDDLIG